MQSGGLTVLRHAFHHTNFKISHSLATSQWLSLQKQDSNNQALRTPNLVAGTKMIRPEET